MQGEMLYEAKIKLLDSLEIGPVPEGRRLNAPFTGNLTGPNMHGKIEGIDYVLIRPDGVGVLHIHAILTTDGGDIISIGGSGLMTAAPDGRFAIKAALTFQTASKELAWLNSIQAVEDGFADLTTSELNVKAFRL